MLNRFQWYRRMIGGKWGRVTSPILGGKKWVHVSSKCSDRIEEEWGNLRGVIDYENRRLPLKTLRDNFAFHLGHNSTMWEKQDYRGTALIERILKLFDEAARDT